MSHTLRIGMHQGEPGTGIPEASLAVYRNAGIDVLVLPEYFWIRPEDTNHLAAAAHADQDLQEMAALSRNEGWLVAGGTVVESRDNRFYNACPVMDKGRELGRYRKMHLMPGEAESGISPGTGFVVLETLGLRLAPVICADVLHGETFDHLAALQPDLILAPMSSPLLPDDTPEEKDRRDRQLFLAGAVKVGAPIVKVGGMGTLFGRPLQGRCLVATPDEILFRTPFAEELLPRTWVVDVPVPARDRGKNVRTGTRRET